MSHDGKLVIMTSRDCCYSTSLKRYRTHNALWVFCCLVGARYSDSIGILSIGILFCALDILTVRIHQPFITWDSFICFVFLLIKIWYLNMWPFIHCPTFFSTHRIIWIPVFTGVIILITVESTSLSGCRISLNLLRSYPEH